jgi:hypothetical protein
VDHWGPVAVIAGKARIDSAMIEQWVTEQRLCASVDVHGVVRVRLGEVEQLIELMNVTQNIQPQDRGSPMTQAYGSTSIN